MACFTQKYLFCLLLGEEYKHIGYNGLGRGGRCAAKSQVILAHSLKLKGTFIYYLNNFEGF